MNKFFCIKFELYIYSNYKYKDKDCGECENCIYKGVVEDMKKIAIVGMRYIDKKFNLNHKLNVGCKISLVEEENNKYDKKAIMACYLDDEGKFKKFGYVAKNNNDGSIDTNLVYEIISHSYYVLNVVKYEKKQEEEYYERMKEIDNEYLGLCQWDKPSIHYNFNKEIEQDKIFDDYDDEMNNPYYRCLFWRGY